MIFKIDQLAGLSMRLLFLLSLAEASFHVLPVMADDYYNDGNYQLLSDSQLDSLVAPVALYPDNLLIDVFQAATHPDQISAAVGWLRLNSDTSQIALQFWNPSIIAIAYYPSIINMLYQQTSWTALLGQAYQNQSSDLLDSVQRRRAQARNQGNLVSTSQQTVSAVGDAITIAPVDPTMTYVPKYDPALVYSQAAPVAPAPLVAFGAGVAVASGANASVNQVDWDSHTVVYHNPSTGYVRGQDLYGAGPVGYGQGYAAQGTGVYGNQFNTGAAAGRTWNGGAYAGTATTNQWQNGATTGSYNAAAVGPNGAADSRGWTYQNGDLSAGTFSKTVDTSQGVYNIHGAAATNGDKSVGGVTATGVSQNGDFASRSWSENDGSFSSTGRSGSLFSGAESGGYASSYGDRGAASRFGGASMGGFDGGGYAFGGRGRR